MKRLRETDTSDSLLNKFKEHMSLKNVNKRVQGASKTPSREQIKLADFKSAFAKAKKAGYKNPQDYTNVVARYGSEDNMKRGRGLGT